MATDDSFCIFCIQDAALGTPDVESERILKGYKYWWLVLHQPKKRAALVQAAGMLVLKRHTPGASECSAEEFGELPSILHEVSALLCNTVGAEYTQQTRLGFNEGREAGQTRDHVHLHLLPVSESDPVALKVRGGIGGAFEALRAVRLGQKEYF